MNDFDYDEWRSPQCLVWPTISRRITASCSIFPHRAWLFYLLNCQESARRGKKSNHELELDYLLGGFSSAVLLHCG